MRVRAGFTVMELVIVLILVGVVGAVAAPNVGRMTARTNLQRAANVVALDLQSAFSLAARQRKPVRIDIDPTNKVIRVQDDVTGGQVFAERRFDGTSDFAVAQMLASPTSIVVYPNGLASAQLRMSLRAGGAVRSVVMSRAGQVRIQ